VVVQVILGKEMQFKSVQIHSANGSGTKRSYRHTIYCKRKIWPSNSVGHFMQLEWKPMKLINFRFMVPYIVMITLN